MAQTCMFGKCCMMSLGCFLLWWLVASGLLFLTWNKVVGAMMKVKSAKYWQALLLVATLCSFAMPCRLMQSFCHNLGGCQYKCKGRGGDKGEKEPCPYSHDNNEKNVEDARTH